MKELDKERISKFLAQFQIIESKRKQRLKFTPVKSSYVLTRNGTYKHISEVKVDLREHIR